MPAELDFGNVRAHSDLTIPLSVINCGQASIGVTFAIDGPSASRFAVEVPATNSIPLPPDPSGSNPVFVNVSYSPELASSQDFASLEVLVSVDGAPQYATVLVPLSGKGM
jgi:hypothetical protein